MQSVSSRIRTRVAVSISYDDNVYTTGTSKNDGDDDDDGYFHGAIVNPSARSWASKFVVHPISTRPAVSSSTNISITGKGWHRAAVLRKAELPPPKYPYVCFRCGQFLIICPNWTLTSGTNDIWPSSVAEKRIKWLYRTSIDKFYEFHFFKLSEKFAEKWKLNRLFL